MQIAGPLVRTTVTDLSGYYEFPVLSVGAYELNATLFGYAIRTIGDLGIQKDQITVQNIALQPMPAFSLSGLVLDSRGQPIPNATVTIMNTPIAPAVTAADGSYGFPGIPAGEYDVQAVGCGRCADATTQHLILAADRVGFVFVLPLHADAFGYWCTVVAPAYVEAGTDIGLSGDDNYSRISLPFPFCFYGQTYTAAWVSCNGFLTFSESDAGAFWGGWIPDPATPNAAIYAFWSDMMVGPAREGFNPPGTVRTQVVGEAPNRQFVVEWRNLRRLGRTEVMDVEIVLFENGHILAQYRNLPNDDYYRGLGCTMGLENETGTTALLFCYSEKVVASPQAAILYQLDPSAFLQGHVIDAADGSPIAGATVVVLEGSSLVRSLRTDANGFYRTQVPLGQYTIRAASGGYTTGSALVALDTENATCVQDFSLQAPRAVVHPSALTFEIASGQSRSQTLSLRNAGSLDLVWEIGTGGTLSADFNSGLPAGSALYGTAFLGADGGVDNTPALRLTDAFVYWSRGLWVIDDLNPGMEVKGFAAKFKLLIGKGDAAEGLSFNFAKQIPGFQACDWEEGTSSGLSVCFDTHDSWGGEAPAIDVKVDGLTVAWQPVDAAFLRQGRFVDVAIEVTPEQTLTLTFDGQTIFQGVPVPGVPRSGRFAFGARTGGLSDHHWVDDLSITTWQADLPWLTRVPSSGVLSPGASQAIQVAVDATSLDTGSYLVLLTINNNSARTPKLSLPVTVIVSGPCLQGHVKDANNGLALAGATVVVSRGRTVLRTLTTDAAGFYQTQLPLGEYAIEATLDNYSSESAALLADNLEAIYTRDFALRTAYLRGHVTDANNGQPVVSANVSFYRGSSLLRSLSTDGDGLYVVQLPPGEYLVQSGKPRYGTESTQLTLESRTAAYVQDFKLKSPIADVSPAALNLSVPLGQSRSQSLILNNTGSLDLVWEIIESGSSVILRSATTTRVQNPNRDLGARTTRGLALEPTGGATVARAGDILKSWRPSSLASVWGIGFDGDLWLSDLLSLTDTEFTVDGASTGLSWATGWAHDWAADMAYDFGRGIMYQVGVGGANSIGAWDALTGILVAEITDPSRNWTLVSQRGVAYRPDDDTLFVGGWNQGIIFHLKGLSWDTPGEVLDSFLPHNGNGYEWGISGLAWDSRRNILWEASNSFYDSIYALNPETGEVMLTLAHPNPYYNGGGLESDADGNLWMVSQNWSSGCLRLHGLPDGYLHRREVAFSEPQPRHCRCRTNPGD